MIPKTIHLCWFSDDPYPVEIKMCLESWEKLIPDYKVRLWTADDARAIGMPFINEALEERRWAFAADAVRVYAIYTEGGVYADSDILLYKRFDDFLPKEEETDAFVTFHEQVSPHDEDFGLNAAFFIGTKGNTFCRELLAYYTSHHYLQADGTRDDLISPHVMRLIAKGWGWVMEDRLQDLAKDGAVLRVYPTYYLAPRKKYRAAPEAFGRHCVYGSWRKRKWGRRMEIKTKHVWNVVKYFFTHLGR